MIQKNNKLTVNDCCHAAISIIDLDSSAIYMLIKWFPVL